MAEWFKEWFNTKEYLFVYRNRNEADAKKLVDLILRNTYLQSGAKVLDMACGTGRHSILFAEKDFNVTAVDLSSNLLSVAKISAEETGVKINFIQSDLRHFSITTKFSLAVNLFTSFGYFEDDEENYKIFRNAYNFLTAPGYFVLDYFNRHNIEQNLVSESVENIFGETIIQRRSILGDRVVKQILVRDNGSEKNYYESVRMFSKDELFSALLKCGFRINKYFGDSSGNAFDLERSPRIIIIAQK